MAFLKGIATADEPEEAAWGSDYHLLRSASSLMGTTSQALLQKIAANTGDTLSLRSLRNGARLPIMSKAQLQRALEERIQIEQQTIENACRDSRKLATGVLPLFLAIGSTSLLLV